MPYTKLSGFILFLTICCLFSLIVEESNSKFAGKLTELFDEGDYGEEKGSGGKPSPGPEAKQELKALREIVDVVRLTRY